MVHVIQIVIMQHAIMIMVIVNPVHLQLKQVQLDPHHLPIVLLLRRLHRRRRLLLAMVHQVAMVPVNVYAMAKKTATVMEALTVKQYMMGQITPMIMAKLFATLIKTNVLMHIHPVL